jgi:hypothetical protein
MKTKQNHLIITVSILIILALIICGVTYFNSQNSKTAVSVNDNKNATSSMVYISDAQVSSAIFPSDKWTELQLQITGSTNTNAYKEKNQKGDLPLLWTDSIKKGDADKDSREDALARVNFCGADCDTEIKFVHNVEPLPVSLDFLSNQNSSLGVDFPAGKTYIQDFGFTDNGFYVTYSGNFNDNQQRIDYSIINGRITVTAKGQVTASNKY